MIDVLEIGERRRDRPMGLRSPDDFTYRKIGEADAAVLVTDPTVSLYTLDHATRHALFVQVPDDVDLTAAPFVHVTQYDHALRLFAVPYAVFHHVAAGIELRAPLVFIHSTGRAGSTLMSKALGEMRAAVSLSEPDAYSQAAVLRLSGGDDDEIRALLTSATKLLFNPAFAHGSALNVVKFTSFCTEVADLLYGAFPDAGTLFLYRDLADHARSAVRVFGVNDTPPEEGRAAVAMLATATPLLAAEMKRRPDFTMGLEVPCLIWLSAVHAYARSHHQGIPMLAVRYDDLVADPRGMLTTILGYLGLPVDGVDDALRAFTHDSQAGSPLSREEAAKHTGEIEASGWEHVRELLRRYPIPGADMPAVSVGIPS